MKDRTKIFFILWILAVISTILIIPYILNIQAETLKEAKISSRLLIIISLIQGSVIFGIASFFGLILAEKTGFKLPLMSSWFSHKKINYRNTLVTSVILGSIVGILIILLDSFVFQQGILSSINVQLWQGFLASFYGGIAEEIIMRLFLMSLFVFALMKFFRKEKANSAIVWFSIILVSVIFGLGHLPITSSITTITPMVVIRAIVLNGIGGIVFGWLYWKKGLEAAIIAHFVADIFIQIVFPILFK